MISDFSKARFKFKSTENFSKRLLQNFAPSRQLETPECVFIVNFEHILHLILVFLLLL